MTATRRNKPAKRAKAKAARPSAKAKKKTAPKKVAAKPRASARKPVARKPQPAKKRPAAKTRPAARPAAKARPAARPAAKAAPRAIRAGVAPAAPIDPAVELYETALRALFAQRWTEAARLFRRVLSDRDGAEADLQERALQQLHICEDKLAGTRGAAVEDPFLLAVVRKNAGDYEEALQLCTRGGRQSKDERFADLAASIHALRDESEDAARFLGLAIELNPKNRVHAFHDPDFQALRESGALDRLFRG
jgi:tetratricopeptide (TPR) repeat protein